MLVDPVQSFNYSHASAFCAPSLASLRRLFQKKSTAIFLKLRWLFWFPTNVRDDFNCLKWTSFLAESHFFALNTLRIVYWMETNVDNWLHHSFVANDASFGKFTLLDVILFGLPMYQQILFLFYQPSVEAISCVQKCKKHFKTWLRQTVTNVWLSFVFTRTRKRLKPIDHMLLKFA